MPSTSAAKKRSFRKRSVSSKVNFFQRWFAPGLKILFSPLVLLWDSFREKKGADKSWVFAFFLLSTVIMGIACLGSWITDSPADRTLRLLTGLSQQSMLLNGDLDPVIHTINLEAVKYKIDPNLIFALVQQLSGFNPKKIGAGGGRGLMQLTPEVWQRFGDRNPAHVWDPNANIRAGVRYLSFLVRRYRGRIDLALEAYQVELETVQTMESKAMVNQIYNRWMELRREVILLKLKAALQYRTSLKICLGAAFFCWLLLFWWANRKLFPS